ncbi:MAG TPA: YhbY family RNA-binding protein [Longimicrobiaceae bacterium]|nr:YhbY family RNA-binding protein [Longimicrobiaceae bacterium]
MTLSAKQRAELRSLAHHLKAIHHVGKEGITPATISALGDAFNKRELVKIKVQDSAPLTAAEAGPLLAAEIPGATHVQTIGKTVVLYRPHPEKPEINV